MSIEVEQATSVPLGMADASYLETIFANQLQALQTEYVDVYMLHAAGVQNLSQIHNVMGGEGQRLIRIA